MSASSKRDSEDLLYYARQGAEKQSQLMSLRMSARNLGELDPARIPLIEQGIKTQNKFDCDKILEKYTGDVAIVALRSRVKGMSGISKDAETVAITGRLTSIDFKKALFKVVTDSGRVEVAYADAIPHANGTEPSTAAVIELELVEPVSTRL